MFGRRKEPDSQVTTICALNISSSDKKYGDRSVLFLHPYDDSWLYFDENKNELFKIIDFQWAGMKSETRVSSHSVAETSGKTKRKGRFIGAAVGTIIAPGAGTLIGAMHGTGNNKLNSHTETSSYSSSTVREVPSKASITIEFKDSRKEVIHFRCMSATANILLSYVTENEMENSCTDDSDNINKIKQLKELLDIGAITQDEYDAKKNDLLEKI